MSYNLQTVAEATGAQTSLNEHELNALGNERSDFHLLVLNNPSSATLTFTLEASTDGVVFADKTLEFYGEANFVTNDKLSKICYDDKDGDDSWRTSGYSHFKWKVNIVGGTNDVDYKIIEIKHFR